MKFGYFDDANKEYVITSPRTPYPWINYLGTQDFFSLISNTAGGYSFYKDARLRRITRYRYNNVPIDMGGRYFYINENGTIWNPGWSPVKTELDSYECRHGMGYTIITGKKNDLKAEVTFFVPQNYTGEVQQVVLTNEGSAEKTFTLYSFEDGVSGMHRTTAQTSRETSAPDVSRSSVLPSTTRQNTETGETITHSIP